MAVAPAPPSPSATPAGGTGQSVGRTLWRTGSALAAAAAAGAGAAGWWTTRSLTTTPAHPTRWPVLVSDLDGDRVRLSGPGAGLPGTWGLCWADGYARVLPAQATEDADGTRRLAWREGDPRPGTRAAMCPYAWPARPAVLGLPWGEVALPPARARHGHRGPAASHPSRSRAWRFGAAHNRDWVIFVHGRGSLRTQAFRSLPTVVASGWTALAITYRGDIEQGGGRSDLGAHEWIDLEAAVRYARDAGARRIVAVGFSMGGAIVAHFLHRSPLASGLSAVVLEAPVLDWDLVLRHHARRLRLPSALGSALLAASHLRSCCDPRAADHREHAARWTAPVLLIHGTGDPVVPVGCSDRLAEARPDLVTYLRVPDAGHVTAWNTDPHTYEIALARFLGELS